MWSKGQRYPVQSYDILSFSQNTPVWIMDLPVFEVALYHVGSSLDWGNAANQLFSDQGP